MMVVAGGAFVTWPSKKNLLYVNLPFVSSFPSRACSSDG